MFFYGFAVNIFLAGGGLNTFFVMLPAGLLFSVPLTAAQPVRRRPDPARPDSTRPGPGPMPGAARQARI
jgi:hypothetical protein